MANSLRQDGYVLDAEVRCGIKPEGRRVISLFLDSGVRRGSDVFKAIALGATACLLG